jgi:hypothetical protein
MDSRAVAEALGTSPRILRQFLRSPQSTFQAVGSNARYDFKQEDMPSLVKRFNLWAEGRSKVTVAPQPDTKPAGNRVVSDRTQVERDRAVWAEEGPVVLPDIRNPHTRRKVLAEAEGRVRRLDERLLAAGLHISQWRDRAE